MSGKRPVQGRGLFSRLGRLFGPGPLPADAAEELAALREAVAGLAEAQAEGQGAAAALCEAVERLEKQATRAGKEQFRANALAEAQQEGLKAALERLREADAARERDLAHLRERLGVATAEGRMEVVERLLPVLDGLGEALAAGRHLLEEVPGQGEGRGIAPLSLRQRVAGAWALMRGTPLKQDAARDAFLRDALVAWLEGLAFVEARLLDVLAGEGVRPMETAGAIFDPHLYVAVEAVPSADGLGSGRVVGETRRGYLAGDSVLRYAEVVVTR